MANRITDTDIINYFLTAPMAEATLLHRWIGAALQARGRVTPTLAAAAGYVPPAGDSGVTSTLPAAPVAPQVRQRRRRRTRAELAAADGPATNRVEVGGYEGAVEPSAQGDGDAGLPAEEIGS